MKKRAYFSDESQTNLILILTFKIFLDLHSRFKHLLFDSPPIEPANIETIQLVPYLWKQQLQR